MGTEVAEERITTGGRVPAGMRRMMLCEAAVTIEVAAATSSPSWSSMRITATPSKLVDSIFLMPDTLPASENSENSVICCSICCAESPEYDHTTLMIGMSTAGKRSVGVRRIT